MKSDEPDQIDFVLLGRYAPREAARLLARFEKAGIPFRMQSRKPAPEPGPTASIYISVDAARAIEVAEIHRDLFGDGLPNYDSSFFRDHHNV
jgi:hypothetical protein